jgi:DNA repair exonuclease SbcCD ATPase subunit
MRRNPAVEEALPEPDPQRQALVEVMAVLAPLRELRKHAAERRCREAHHRADHLLKVLAQAESACDEDLLSQRHERRTMVLQCEGKLMSIGDVQQWRRREQLLLEQQAAFCVQVQEARKDLQLQRLQNEDLEAELRACQHALEKLACLREILG